MSNQSWPTIIFTQLYKLKASILFACIFAQPLLASVQEDTENHRSSYVSFHFNPEIQEMNERERLLEEQKQIKIEQREERIKKCKDCCLVSTIVSSTLSIIGFAIFAILWWG